MEHGSLERNQSYLYQEVSGSKESISELARRVGSLKAHNGMKMATTMPVSVPMPLLCHFVFLHCSVGTQQNHLHNLQVGQFQLQAELNVLGQQVVDLARSQDHKAQEKTIEILKYVCVAMWVTSVIL